MQFGGTIYWRCIGLLDVCKLRLDINCSAGASLHMRSLYALSLPIGCFPSMKLRHLRSNISLIVMLIAQVFLAPFILFTHSWFMYTKKGGKREVKSSRIKLAQREQLKNTIYLVILRKQKSILDCYGNPQPVVYLAVITWCRNLRWCL